MRFFPAASRSSTATTRASCATTSAIAARHGSSARHPISARTKCRRSERATWSRIAPTQATAAFATRSITRRAATRSISPKLGCRPHRALARARGRCRHADADRSGPDALTIDGGVVDRVILHSAYGTLTLSGLTIGYGFSSDYSGGGCIAAASTLDVRDSTVKIVRDLQHEQRRRRRHLCQTPCADAEHGQRQLRDGAIERARRRHRGVRRSHDARQLR